MDESPALSSLRAFRHALYACFERRADALMDLTDALLTAGPVLSPAHLSLEAVHRRGWGSVYTALAAGRVNAEALRALLSQYPLSDGQPVYAVDSSVWPRCAAATSPERGYYHHSSRHSGGTRRATAAALVAPQRRRPGGGGVIVSVDQPTRLPPRQLDRTAGRAAHPPHHGYQHGGRDPDQGPAPPAAR